ncbi:MAG: hypothetical protein WBL50_03395 [Candidatus Acidiferrum sp.]
MLSKYRPVGVMIYGAADFMGIPWDTIIKQYRRGLGTRGFQTVQDYANDFLRFVERQKSFFPEERQRVACYELTQIWLHRLRTRLRKAIDLAIKTSGPVSEETVRQKFREIVKEDIDHLRMHKRLPHFAKFKASALLGRYRPVVRNAIKETLQNLDGAVSMNTLQQGAALAIMQDLYWYGETGLVIAGFGEEEFCPSLCCHTLDSIVGGRLRVLENVGKRSRISNIGNSASIIPFAQSEMVSLFMNGIDDDCSDFLRSFATKSFTSGYPDALGRSLDKYLTEVQKAEVLEQVRDIGKQLSEKLESVAREYAKYAHSDPIIEIVNHLPKEELAAMAEALVNLTSFKRHVTRQAETVGGPIDVAVISRGDGFIWVKRKHYFTKELNPHFLANYFHERN